MTVPTFNIPNQTESKMKSIINNWFQNEKQIKTQNDFFKKVDAFVASWRFETEEQAFQEVAKSALHFWDEFEWIDLQAIVQPKEIEVETQEQIQEPEEEISGLDIWVKTWQAISETAQKFKFQSNVDDNILQSGLKFIWNLPANTAQIAGDLITVASDPVWTIKDVQTLSDAIVQDWLNKIFLDEWEEVFSTEEAREVSWAIKNEFDRIVNEPGRVKELLVENPADVLLTVTWWVWVAKNAAKSKWLTWLANKLEKVENATNPIKLQAEAVKWTGKAISRTKQSIFPEKSLDEIVLEVSQGTEKNIPAVKETLSKIDTRWVETYKDLNRNISQKISEIAKKQDELLPKDEVLNIQDLTTTKGKRTTNFVNNALDDLENVWENTSDLELLNKVDDLRDKEFVSVKDINDLARFYGSQFKNKSFDKLGNQKANISASRFENTRKGLKDISRDLLPDDTVKLLDEELSKLFETQTLTEKMAENVTKLSRKIEQRGLFENLARWLGKAVDLASLWTARWFLTSFLPSNVWNKILNSLAIEWNLIKNLKKIQQLQKKADKMSDEELLNEARKTFWDIIWDNALKIEWASSLENNE